MTESSADLFIVALRPMRRIMWTVGMAAPRCDEWWPNQQSSTKQMNGGVHRAVAILHSLAVIIILAMGVGTYYDSWLAVDNALLDTMTMVIDILGYVTALTLHLIIELESNWFSGSYAKIIASLQRMELLYTKFWQCLAVATAMKVNTVYWVNMQKRVRLYSRMVYVAVGCFYGSMGVLIFIYSWRVFSNTRGVLGIYSEFLVRLKLFEFMLFEALIYAILRELIATGLICVQQLSRIRHIIVPAERRASIECIVLLQDIHSELWRAIRAIERYFNWSLPGLLAKIFVDMTLVGYWMLLVISSGKSIDIRYYVSFCCATISVNLLALFAIFHLGFLGRQFRALFYGLSGDRQNRQFTSCLRRMCLQLTHETVHFSAGGFTFINCSTFGRFLFMMITYMVILIQFRMSV